MGSDNGVYGIMTGRLGFCISESPVGQYIPSQERTLILEWDWRGLCLSCRGREATMTQTCSCQSSELWKRLILLNVLTMAAVF